MKERCIRVDFEEPAFTFDTKDSVRTLIGPKDQIQQGECVVTKEEMADYATKRKKLFVVAEATYGDAIDPNPLHVTRMCLTLEGLTGPAPEPVAGIALAMNNVNFLNCPNHNCADEECLTDK